MRRGRVEGWRISGAVLVTLGLLFLAAGPAGATLKYGPLQLSGSVDTQTWVRHRSIGEYQFVQNRNTALLRLDYDMFQNGKLIDKYEIPFFKSAKLYMLYRGVYDSFYDILPGGRQVGLTRYDDIVGGPISGHDRGDLNANGTLLSGLYQRLYRHSNLNAGRADLQVPTWLRPNFKTIYSGYLAKDDNINQDRFENRLREAYIDLRMRDLPISLRLGRQQVIWGESDQFRLMDIWNPLDLTWHVQQEEWDKLRVPLWLAKGIYDIGQLGPLSNTFVEVVWNPGDYQPGAKVDFLPHPWGIPIANPLRPGQVQLPSTATVDANGNPVTPQPIALMPIFDLGGTNFQQGDFHRNPAEASDVGTRFHAVTPQGVEFTLNYLYIRGRGIGASAGSPFALRIKDIQIPTPTTTTANALPYNFSGLTVFPAEVTAELVHPYSHIFGLTGNYFEGNWTNTVFRLETAYQMGAPFQSIDQNLRVPVQGRRNNGTLVQQSQIAPLGFTKRNIWAGMVGFDRPTWIKWLNARTTWFITGQFFWSYIDGPTSDLRGQVLTASESPYITPQNPANVTVWPASLTANQGLGQWTSGPFAGVYERTQNQDATNGALNGNADNVRRWELLSTLAATSFYRGGTVVPFGAMALDPVNENFLVQLKVDYFVTNNVIIQLRQNFYTNFGASRASIDPWGAGGLLARRDETGLKVTYQF